MHLSYGVVLVPPPDTIPGPRASGARVLLLNYGGVVGREVSMLITLDQGALYHLSYLPWVGGTSRDRTDLSGFSGPR